MNPQKLAIEQQLRPWPEVARRWNKQSGENISVQRCVQVAQKAIERMRRKLDEKGSAPRW